MPHPPLHIRRRRLAAWLALPVLPLGLAPCAVGQPEPVQIASWDRSTNPLIGVSEALLARLYAEVGQPMRFVDLPARRAGLLLRSGEVDANTHRAHDFIEANPGVVAVATPLNHVQLRAYARDPALALAGWAELTRWRVAHLRGVVRVEQLMPAGVHRVEAGSLKELWRLLATEAADVAILSEPAGSPTQKPAGVPGLRRLETVLDEHSVHHVLAGRHAALAQKLNAALLRLQASGELDTLRESTLQALLKRQGGADNPRP
ncbi:substrate-binding periplasmic protein [Roseateles saccharophilus]|uniref:ABC-type amino acid transport substrate-binding protein n=1 Tax=Roseateles saccharophilus TaxID=304 RepID=A0A4R3VKE6_ROSSA|nr:transporter substrate-binding domain-containing protein [Roseateles saccharophilus]TCV04338.1 ABC-type amino acid transport substrate-binding protein [Roseateles saccharophilus]